MNGHGNVQKIEKTKVIPIAVLLAASAAIIISGIGLVIYSIVYDVSFRVLNSQVHGLVFGLVIAFLGVRYFLSVQKLKVEVYKSTSVFSWNNFRKRKAQ